MTASTQRRAVIDVGSNSVLLLVAEEQNGKWVPIHEATAVTALGEGTKATGLLGERGMTDTLRAVGEFSAAARDLGVPRVIAAATMAARIASNTSEFLRRADEQGTRIVVLSGEDEAELGFRAVANDPLFEDASRISIIDPGGHSTEVVTADRVAGGWHVRFRKSYSVGTLGMKTEVLPDECADSWGVLQATSFLDDRIGMVYLPGQCGQVVTLGATGTNLITIRERMTEWDPAKVHGGVLEYEEVGKAVGWLMPMTDAERAAIPGMEKGREKTMALGSLILERFMYALRAESCAVSVRGWRYALLEDGLPPSAESG